MEEYGKDGYKGKSPIFSKRMIEAHCKPVHADTPIDALAISMQEVGRVDLDYMRALTGRTNKEIIDALEFEKIYFDFKKQEYQIAEEYLSGDIRDKIEFVERKIQQTEMAIDKKLSTAVNRDKVGEILADRPLIALDAIRLGRNNGYAKSADLMIRNCREE